MKERYVVALAVVAALVSGVVSTSPTDRPHPVAVKDSLSSGAPVGLHVPPARADRSAFRLPLPRRSAVFLIPPVRYVRHEVRPTVSKRPVKVIHRRPQHLVHTSPTTTTPWERWADLDEVWRMKRCEAPAEPGGANFRGVDYTLVDSHTGTSYYGAYQFDLPTWRSVGGPGLPSQQSRATQDYYAWKLYESRGFQPWECARIIGIYP